MVDCRYNTVDTGCILLTVDYMVDCGCIWLTVDIIWLTQDAYC